MEVADFCDLLGNLPNQLTDLILINIFEQDNKFITGPSGNYVGGSTAPPQYLTDRNQHLIAFLVAKGIISQLEAIDITHDHKIMVILLVLETFKLQLHKIAVFEPGQRV